MTKKAICTCALALGLMAVVGTSSLSAQDMHSNRVTIPFAFHVEKVVMPAGEYRIERVFGKEIVTLVNLQTGQRVQILWPDATRTAGKSKLVFENGPNGYSLKRMS